MVAVDRSADGVAAAAANPPTVPIPSTTTDAAAEVAPAASTVTTKPLNDTSLLPLDVGDSCLVRWRDGGQTLAAKVLARRALKRIKTETEATNDDLEKLAADQLQYYVHYVDHDRRLDEWVTLDKFVLETLNRNDTNEPEGELTAHIKPSQAPVRTVSGGAGGSKSNLGGAGAGPAKANRRIRGSLGGKLPQPPLPQQPPPQPVSDLVTTTTTLTASDVTSFSLTGGNWHGIGGDPALAALEREHEETTKVKNIQKIVMGGWEMEAWYYSPYPGQYGKAETLYVCEYCLKYMRKQSTFRRHVSLCLVRQPPGKQIYRDGTLTVYEIDGREQRCYCQCLCLLAKLYIDHKTLYYDVDPFYFYVVTEEDEFGAHIVGYFSKEKVSAEDYNLACILTFPQHQQNGYGKFIISLSYELTKLEKTTGSPEKPLSDLGKISYRSYWTHVLMHYLAERDPNKDDISLKEMSLDTGIKTEDIISTLQSLDMVMCWKGQHVIFVKQDVITNYLKQEKKFRLCKPECLDWVPPRQRRGDGENKENI